MLHFDDFELDPEGCRLVRAGAEVPLEPRAMDLLCYLASRPGVLIRKDQLLTDVWRAHNLSDGVLSNTVNKLRRALGQDSRAQAPIETVRGRGYRWRAAAHDPSARRAPAPQPSAGDGAADPFVGRRAVLDQLTHALDRAAGGSAQLLVISGEAGVGKTRTLAELARLAREREFHVWSGAAYDDPGLPPYWPWIELLRSAHTALTAGTWRSHLPAEPRALPLLVPELFRGARATSGDDQPARFRLFDELARFLGSCASASPCMLLLDDLQWADAASLELLAYVARALAGCPILFAASVRDRDSSPGHQPALERLQRVATNLALSGLLATEVLELVRALHGDAAGDARVHEALHRRTGGNPFFVRQILALLAQRALVANSANVEAVELPAAVHGILHQRIAALPEPTRRVLATACAIGQEFDAVLLANVLEQNLESCLSALEPARQAGVVQRSSNGTHRFGFSHALLREVLYGELEWSACGALHGKLARALSAQPLRDDARRLGEVASHYLRAVPSELAASVHYCRIAAQAAHQACGFEVAAELLTRALDKLTSEGGDAGTCCDLLLELALNQLCADDMLPAWRSLERGAALASGIGRPDLLAGFACRMTDWLEFSGNERETWTRLEQALAAVGDEQPALRAALLARHAKLHEELGAAERSAQLDVAERLAVRSGETAALVDVWFCRTSLRDPRNPRRDLESVAQYRKLVRDQPSAQRSLRDELRQVNAGVTEYVALLTLGNVAAAGGVLSRTCTAAHQFQVSALNTVVDLLAAGYLLARGQLDELEASVQRHLETVSSLTGPEGGWFLYAFLLAQVRGRTSEWREVSIPVAAADETGRLRNTHYLLALSIWSAWMYASTGRREAALAALAAVSSQRLEHLPARYGDLGLLCRLAAVYCELGDVAAALRLREQLAPYAAFNAVGVLGESGGSVAAYVGMLDELLGEPARASEAFARAEATNRAWGIANESIAITKRWTPR